MGALEGLVLTFCFADEALVFIRSQPFFILSAHSWPLFPIRRSWHQQPFRGGGAQAVDPPVSGMS